MATQTIDIVARDKTKGVMRGIEGSLGKIAVLAAGAFGVQQLGRYANTIQTVTNRLKLTEAGQKNLNAALKNVQGIANRARQDLDSVSDLYQKIALATKDLGLSQEAVAQTTETFTKLLSIAGAESGTAAGAIRQFAQALGSGAFRGDEFNSVVEAAPQILDILAKETGKARGQIRALAADGKLTADVLINALLKSAKDVDEQFAKTSPTLGQAFTVLNNNVLALANNASPVFSAISKSIIVIANNLDTAAVAATTFVSAMAIGKIVAVAGSVGRLKGAVVALNVVMRANPLVTLATAAASASIAVYKLLGPILELEGTLGNKLLYAIQSAMNSFLNFFEGVGRAAFEVGKMIVAGLNPFDDISLKETYENFGTNMFKAFNEGFKKDRLQFVDPDVQADFEKQLSERQKEIEDALNKKKPLTINITPDAGAYTEAGFKINKIEESLLNEREKINLEYKKREVLINNATKHEIQMSGKSAAEQLIIIEKDRQKKLAVINEQEMMLQEQIRVDKINKAMSVADEVTKLEIEKAERIREINLLTEDILKEAGIDRATAIRNIEKKFESDRTAALKRQAEEAKEIAKTERINNLKELGRTQEEAESYYDFENKSQREKTTFAIAQSKTLFTSLAQVNKRFAAISKAIAIAEAVRNTYLGATKALASYPPPFNFIAAAAVVASGLAQVATIRAQPYQRGGDMRTGQTALVGEAGPELIVPRQPSTVIPNEVATAITNLKGDASPVNVNFNINTVDASDFDSLLVERRGTIVGIINQAMERRGKMGVA